MYSGKSNGSLATTPSRNNPLPHTSETLSGTASNDNISQSGDESKTRFSLDDSGGNIIPPSERFDANQSDIRYSLKGTQTTRETLELEQQRDQVKSLSY